MPFIARRQKYHYFSSLVQLLQGLLMVDKNTQTYFINKPPLLLYEAVIYQIEIVKWNN